MDEAECGKRSALKGARCVWEGARSLDFAYFTNNYLIIFTISLTLSLI